MSRRDNSRSRDPGYVIRDGNDFDDAIDDGADTDGDDNTDNDGRLNYRHVVDCHARKTRSRTATPSYPCARTKTTHELIERHEGVIKALFSHPKCHTAPKEVNWRDFTAMMADLGFSLTPVRGSIWHLRVEATSDLFPAGSTGKAITVHQPHKPDGQSTMRLPKMRGIGEQLTDRFGWTAETFLPL